MSTHPQCGELSGHGRAGLLRHRDEVTELAAEPIAVLRSSLARRTWSFPEGRFVDLLAAVAPVACGLVFGTATIWFVLELPPQPARGSEG